MNIWLTVPCLAKLTDMTERGVRRNINHGRYTLIRQIEGNNVGRGGKVWIVDINDPAISQTMREKHLSSLNRLPTQSSPEESTNRENLSASAAQSLLEHSGQRVARLPAHTSAPDIIRKSLKR
jgi:ABC-type uncharacterized transport system ATPase component